MTKSKADKAREEQYDKDTIWLKEQEKRKDGPWLCGLRGFTPEWTRIWATCLTEEDAARYMNTRSKRNSNVNPHILGHQEVGWWKED